MNVSSLFSALVKAGVVSASSTPTGAGATAKAEEASHENVIRDTASEYRQAVLAVGIRLNSADIVKCVTACSFVSNVLTCPFLFRQRPPIVKFLYDSLPSQCKQCGVRFPDDTAGRKRLQDHLDTHFRQNRKANQAAGRGYSRSWFIGIDVRSSVHTTLTMYVDLCLLVHRIGFMMVQM